ncbi:MAG: patatin-like phospholipase family protein, partial [Lachnospiraceae bacterium]
MKEATLVLEGGATRGVFTSGVLDYLMEQNLYLSHVIGVSAGSCNALNYVSKQKERTKKCTIHTEKKYNFHHGIRKFVKKKSLLDMDMIFERYPKELFPFDYDTYFTSEMVCEIVATNCETGKAEYLTETQDEDR